MKYLSWFASSVFLGIIAINLSYAGERETRYFRINEAGLENIEKSPHLLTVTSANLKKFPKAVVTFTVTTDGQRRPGSIEPAEIQPERLSGRRHYLMMGEGQFGRSGKPEVVFDRENHTVYIGFVGGPKGKKFFYKEITSPSGDLAPDHMQQLGKLETQ